jgi:hypothetical protein
MIVLIASGAYLLGGLLFAIPFVLVGAGRIDPHAAHGSWGFRILIIPGAMIFWPLLGWRWLEGVPAPPDESNAHRRAAARVDNGPAALTVQAPAAALRGPDRL